MSFVSKSLLFSAVLFGAAEARGGMRGRNQNNIQGAAARFAARFGQAQPAEANQAESVEFGIGARAARGGRGGRGGRGADEDADADADAEAEGRRGGRGGRGGRGRRGGKHGRKGPGLIALDKIEACEDELLLACSLEFAFDMDELQAELAVHEEAREAAKEDMMAWLESSMEGEKPTKPELSSELKTNLKAIRQCLHDVVKDTLSEDSECATALTHPKPEDEVVEEPGPEEELAEAALAK